MSSCRLLGLELYIRSLLPLVIARTQCFKQGASITAVTSKTGHRQNLVTGQSHGQLCSIYDLSLGLRPNRLLYIFRLYSVVFRFDRLDRTSVASAVRIPAAIRV